MKMTMLMPVVALQALTLENWIELAIRTDDMIFSSRSFNPKTNIPSTSLQRGNASTPASKPFTPRSPQDKGKTQNVKVPDEEKQRRRKDSLCIKCSKPGHNMSECRTGWSYKGKGKAQGKASSMPKEVEYETESEN
jgi:hypothetical protein